MANGSGMTSDDAGNTIDRQEMAHHLEIIRRIVMSPDPEDRQRFLVEGLARFGTRFTATLATARESLPELSDDYLQALMRWLSLEPILGWVDEAERRARFATDLIDAGGEGLLRLAAGALLAVPKSSPARDDARARQALLRHLELGAAAGDADTQLSAIDDLVDNELLDETEAVALLERGERLVDRAEENSVAHDFLVCVLGFNLKRAIRARDADDQTALTSAVGAAEAAHARLSQITGSEAVETKRAMLLAAILEVADHSQRAADLYLSVRQNPNATPAAAIISARNEARLRLDLDQDAHAIDALTPFMETLADTYLTAIEPSEVESAGEDFAASSAILAFAQARSGRTEDAVRTLEHGKSLRLRYQIAVRQHPIGARALALERELHALERGVDDGAVERLVDPKSDPMAAATSLQARVLEEYRRVWSTLTRETIAPPTVAAIAAALAADEVAVLLGVGFKGTLAIIVERSARASALLLPDATLERLGECMVDGERGWAMALEAGEDVLDPRPELDRLLGYVDRALGQPLAQALTPTDARRVVIVPHRMYGLVPFWALDALTNYDVVVVPSAAHLCGARPPSRPIRQALLVADPTLDLPLAPLEQDAARIRLTAIGVACSALARERADEARVAAAAASAELFHFAGHGKANLVQSDQSALLLHPDERAGTPGADDLAELAARAVEWTVVDEETRWTTVAGTGRLTETRDLVLDRLERSLDYGEQGTLSAFYQSSELTQFAELWTAGDMAVDGGLAHCQMAVLSACASGVGAIGPCEEQGGLPGALMLAGVPVIVATAWPIGDATTALFVDALYERLASSHGTFDVAAVVNETRQQMKTMSRETAADRLAAAGQTVVVGTDFERDVAVARLRGGDPLPFRHPYEWASFYVLGREAMAFAVGRPES